MILVTGGTGLVGGEILRLLSQAGIAATALVRNPDKAPDLTAITWVMPRSSLANARALERRRASGGRGGDPTGHRVRKIVRRWRARHRHSGKRPRSWTASASRGLPYVTLTGR
jgi:nucleoside-diphosphate-sugar epimerase